MEILIVEDHREVAEVLKLYLKELSLDADIVESAEEAIEKNRAQSYRVFFVDIILPGLSGIDLTKKILIEDPEARVVVMTGGGDGVDIVNQILLDAAVQKGALHSMAKPFNLEDIRLAAERFFELPS